MKRTLCILLSLLLAVTGFAGLAVPASAEGTGKAIRLVTNGAADYITGAQTSNVWFGNYMQSSADSKEPVKWRVLQNADGKLFLLADQNLDVVRYNETYAPVTWETCTLRAWLNGYDGHPYDDAFITSAFTGKELSAVADSSEYGTSGGNDTTDKVFLLSIADAMNTNYGFPNNNGIINPVINETVVRESTNTAYVAAGGHSGSDKMSGIGKTDFWWLRSPGLASGNAAFVTHLGIIAENGDYVDSLTKAVRPALNVDLNSVLFTSAAECGKQSAADGTLSPVGDYTGSEWKLTVLDADRSGFSASCIRNQDGVYTIAYGGAQTGENEKISAMIVDADGVVTYYGVLCDAESGDNNTVTVDVSGKMNKGDKLYVFNEQYNGDKKTDYASALHDVTGIGSQRSLIVDRTYLKEGVNTANAKTIWYGGSAWRVIGYDGQGGASTADTMTLFANGSMGTTMFDQDGNTKKQYSGSDLQKQTNQIFNNAFSGPEQLAVKDTTLSSGTYDGANTDGVEGSSVGYARLWPLSTREANVVNADLRKDSGDWWLRSPGDGSNNVAFVTKQGNVDHSGRSFRSELGVRPAFYVDLDRVIFASAAVGGKQGDGALTPIDGYHGSEWKLTVWEGNHRWFTVNETDVTAHPGGTVTLHYQYAATGENEYISAIVTDADGKALYYGRIAPATTEDGTVRITIPADLEKGSFSLYAFNEQVNGDKHTDYASNLIEVVKPDVVKAADLRTGDTFFMGSYPQSRVTDEDLIAALSAVDCTMTSYGYVKNYKYADNSFQTIDMTYADIAYRGDVYRKVTINENRPSITYDDPSNTYQTGNGYASGETYYFKWEPIEWQTLSNGSEGVYVMSVSLLDSQPCGNFFDQENILTWKDYTIRSWLNEGFYNAAFSAGEQENVLLYTHDNKYFKAEYPQFDDPDTRDRVWLLSKLEAENADYGFTDDASRIAAGTDYAYSQGLRAGYWWLRTKADGYCQTWYVLDNGRMDGYWPGTDSNTTCYGVRPVFMLDPDAVIFPPDNTVVPDMTVTAGDVTYGEDATITATLPDDATGTVDFTLTGGAEDYTFYGAQLNAGKATAGGQLKTGTYTVTASYSGDSRYKPATAETTLTVKPAAPTKAINLVSGKAETIKGAQESSVWFGNYMQSSADSKEPVKWRVLSNADGKLFLLSDQNLDVFPYNKEDTSVTWETSDLRSWLNGYGTSANCGGNDYTNDNFKDSAFSAAEFASVSVTDVENADAVFDDKTVSGGNNTTDKVFLLSIAEAIDAAYGFTATVTDYGYGQDPARATTNKSAYIRLMTSINNFKENDPEDWWLRTPGYNSDVAAVVAGRGVIYAAGYMVNGYYVCVRPAVNVDLGKILFASAAENGKQGDGLTAVGNYTGSDWKLTVKDESRSGFRARCTAIENGVYTIAYSGASTGDNEKISAVIVDADGVVTYYGVLENAKAGENTLTLDVSGKLDDGDKLYIFNEQANGDKKTDYASALVDVTERSILSYDLWVGGIEVTEDCTSGEGWEYAPATNTLTLNDYQYEGEGHALPVGNWVYSADTSRAAIVYAGIEPLNLVIEGDNAVKQTGGDLQTSVGLFSEGALTISGTGTLTAEAGAATLEVSSNTNYTFGILCWGALTVTGGTVTGRGGTGKSLHRTWGIYAKGFELSFGEVYAYGGTVTDTGFNCGLQSVGTVTVSGGKLTCRGEKTPKGSIGLWTGGNMTVTGGTVDVSSGEGSSSGYGIAGGRRGDVLYIGASVESFVSVGTGYAVDDFLTVKNEIPGKGWKTVDGTGNVTEIAANPAPGAGLYMYKKVEFKQFKKYDLWVGDTEVTEECTSGEGWEYAPATNTLTLNNYQYEGAGHSFDDTWNNSGGTYSATAAICYLGSEPLHLVIEDENTVKQTGAGDSSFGILCVTDLDISGTGELNVTAGTATNVSYGIQCVQTLSITGGTIHAFGGSAVYTAGLSAHRFSMDNGEVYAVGGEAGSFSFGIFYAPAGKPDAFCNIAGGKLTCRGGNASSLSCALGFNDSATFSGGEIDLAGGEARSSCGVFVGRAHSSLTICASVDSFVSTGNSGAFDMTFYFKNETDAAAWKNTSGSGEIFTIPAHTEAVATIDYTDYKKIEFPCPVYRVTISGENMTKSSGSDSQTVTKGSTMTDVVYTANDGYYFPEDYATEPVNGVSVTRISFTQITVSGKPDADAAITLPSPTAKGAPDMTVSAESVDVGEEAEVIVTLPADATGKVDVTLTGSKQTYTFYDVALTGGTVTVGGKLKADEYTVTVSYGGNEKYTETAAETTFTVACAHVWNTPTWDWADDYSSAKATFTCTDCGETQTVDASIDVTVVSAEDCTNDRVVTYTASVTIDGTEYTDTTDEITVPDTATGHNWEFLEWDWRIDPTLKYTDAFRPDIYYTVKCSACQEEKSIPYDKNIPVFTAFAPTCTTDGWTQYFAPLTYNGQNHDYTYIFTADVLGDYAKATGHDWDNWREISETQHQRVCKNDSSHTETGVHQWSDWIIADADNHKRLCAVCGTAQIESHLYGSVSYSWAKEGDDWKATASRTCTECSREQDETVTAAGVQSKVPTCTVNGETTYTATFSNPAFETQQKTVADIDALTHDWKTEWSKDGANHWHDCTRCDEKNDEAAHTYGEVTYTWEQTRGAWKATAKRTCTVCKWEETETVTATGTQSKAPTCTVNGETTYTATFSNPAFETQQKTVADIDALNHDWKTAWSKDGVNHWHDCTRCDEKNDEAAHTYGEVTYTWEQTRGAWKATAKRACTVCGWEESETVNAAGAQSKAPTCTVNGETTYTAQFENPAFETQTKTVDDIPALDHAYDAVVTEPTCTEDGYTTHTCPRCGDSYTDSETDALGHAWGEWEIVRTATPNEKGEKQRVCTRCGEVETAEIDELMITSSVDGQTGSSLVVTVPYAKRGAIATTLTAEEPVTYTSSDPKLLTVDDDGSVRFMRLCIFCKSATITTVSADGSKVATCKVNIEIKWWQYIIWFFLGSLWF